jgi:hypothetical protein
MDHHVHIAVTEGLQRRGVDVVTAYEDGAAQMNDAELFTRATELERVLFSQDRDMLVLAEEWLQEGSGFAGWVYAHQLSVTIGQAVRDLALIAQVFDPEDMRNHIQFIPL